MRRFSCNGCGKCCTFENRLGPDVALEDMAALADKVILQGRLSFNLQGDAGAQAFIAAKNIAGPSERAAVLEHWRQGEETLGIPVPPNKVGVKAQIVMLPSLSGRCALLDEANRCQAYDVRPYACRMFPFSSWQPSQVAEASLTLSDCPTDDSQPVLTEQGRVVEPGYQADWARQDQIDASRRGLNQFVVRHPMFVRHGIGMIQAARGGAGQSFINLLMFIDAAVQKGVLAAAKIPDVLAAQASLIDARIAEAKARKLKSEKALNAELELYASAYRQVAAGLAR